MTDFRKTPDKTPRVDAVFVDDWLTEEQAKKLNPVLGRAFGYEAKQQADGSYKVVRKGRRA